MSDVTNPDSKCPNCEKLEKRVAELEAVLFKNYGITLSGSSRSLKIVNNFQVYYLSLRGKVRKLAMAFAKRFVGSKVLALRCSKTMFSVIGTRSYAISRSCLQESPIRCCSGSPKSPIATLRMPWNSSKLKTKSCAPNCPNNSQPRQRNGGA